MEVFFVCIFALFCIKIVIVIDFFVYFLHVNVFVSVAFYTLLQILVISLIYILFKLLHVINLEEALGKDSSQIQVILFIPQFKRIPWREPRVLPWIPYESK